MTTAADITCENSPGLLRVFFHGYEKSCERRPGYEAKSCSHAQNGVSGSYMDAIFEHVVHEESEIWTNLLPWKAYYSSQVSSVYVTSV